MLNNPKRKKDETKTPTFMLIYLQPTIQCNH